MRNPAKRTLSTVLAMAILGCAVMLSVSLAKEPAGDCAENAFVGSPLGLTDKALIGAGYGRYCNSDDTATDVASGAEGATFDWGLHSGHVCPKCRNADPAVLPAILNVSDLLGPGDATTIGVIKRKTGINVFQGSIFDGPDAPAMKLIQRDEPAELHSFDDVLKQIGYCTAPESSAVACDAADKVCGSVCVVPTGCDEACDDGKKHTVGLGVVSAAVNACYDALGGKKVGIGRACSANCSDLCGSSCSNLDEGASYVNPGRATTNFTRSSRSPSAIDEWQINPLVALRHASRGLDEVAANLEEQERYAEADAVREAAEQLRMKARDLKKTAGSNAQVDVHPDKPVAYYVPAGPRTQDDRQAAEELHYFEFAPKPVR